MWNEWRLLQDDIHEARLHFAVEEAIARLLDEGHSPPTLRLRRVYPSVFVGVHQDTWSEVNVEYCRSHGIQIVRRMNGGGAVYHEMGSFCFSAFFPRDFFSQSDAELYPVFAEPVLRTCADYGIHGQFGGRNDVLVNGRKIYGSAQFSFYRAFVQSGTFLVNMNFDAMENALTPPTVKFSGKTAQSIRERVTSLSIETGKILEVSEVMKRFASHFSDVFKVKLFQGNLDPEEKKLADRLFAEKYNTYEWNFGSPLQYQITVAERSQLGVIMLSVDIESKAIQRARITGDLLLTHPEPLKQLEQSLSGKTISESETLIQNIALSSELRETLSSLLKKIAVEMNNISSRTKENENEQDH